MASVDARGSFKAQGGNKGSAVNIAKDVLNQLKVTGGTFA